jgi:twitching motility protein PilT
MLETDFKNLLLEVIETSSPDLHFQIGQSPIVRLKTGSISSVEKYPILTPQDLDDIIGFITNEEQRRRFKEHWEFDFSYSVDGKGRFRVNVFQEKNGPSLAFRSISQHIPTMAEIGLAGQEIERLLMMRHGLILVTGPTGMGKSTTLAAMVDYINQNRNGHIITIEDPIEYVYKNKNSLITQREVNVHTHSFANAIRAALRQDPDVVLVGEMRDLETIAAAVTLAETGHLVFSTLHTPDAAQTVDRIIDVFPTTQQQQIRTQVGTTLRAVISQALLPRLDGQGRVAAREIMITNDGIRNCIVQGQTKQIYSMIQIGQQEGMVLLDQSLEKLVRQGLVSKDDALSKATDIESLLMRLSDV